MNIPVNTDTLPGYLIGRIRLTVVYAGIYRFRIIRCHLPECVFDNSGSVHSHAEFEEKYVLSVIIAEECFIPQSRVMPALVLDKRIVRAQVH